MVELSGYNFKRKEFDIEYDNDAEHLLADMEFKDTDSEADHELKMRILRIYSKRCNKTTLISINTAILDSVIILLVRILLFWYQGCCKFEILRSYLIR